MAGRAFRGIANHLGARWLSFQNPRVVAPPGRVVANRRRNVIVATPMRCGTHVMIDTLLNNLPAYRRAPLYVDLDQLVSWEGLDGPRFGPLTADAGYVVKTHFPIGVPAAKAEACRAAVAALAADALVITVRRDPGAIRASLERWAGRGEGRADGLGRTIARLDDNLEAFWSIWAPRADIALRFEDLFDAERMQAVLAEVSCATGAPVRERFQAVPSRGRIGRIYLHKALTRLAGRRAPRINTTIHVS